jgi:hypothetical protein
MKTPPSRGRLALAATLSLGLLVAAAPAGAADLQPAPVSLKGAWTNGGDATLELESRNLFPVVCFVWRNPAPQDGDSIASRILTSGGAEVVDLGGSDQWIDGAAEGCEIPTDDRYRDVFTNSGRYILEFRVVENQGTPATAPVRSSPLQLASG